MEKRDGIATAGMLGGDIVDAMKTLRIVLGVLMVIPLGLLGYRLFFDLISYDSNSISELVFMVLGVPILVLNLWVWLQPEIIEFYLN